MKKLSIHIIFSVSVLFLSSIAASEPLVPTGLCINNTNCSNIPQNSQGLFPGTNLKFRPGIVVWATQNEPPEDIEGRWQSLFNGERKTTYRPKGVYGGVYLQLSWKLFYKNHAVRPVNPEDHKDPAYDWTKLDAVFNINAVQNEGALVALYPGEIGHTGQRSPNWLKNPPYSGLFYSYPSPKTVTAPKYYRYAGPDSGGNTAKNASPPIVEEIAYFHQALHDHLVETGNIDKVMFVHLSEVFVSNPQLPEDYSAIDLYHGVGLRNKLVASIWAESQIFVVPLSIVGPSRNTVWKYLDNPTVGMSFPDMKLSGSNHINSGDIRFTHPNGTYQKDTRLLVQQTENAGHRTHTYFARNVANPWGYSNVTKPQIASHILWALSGKPKGKNRDSGLGQDGEDPPGIMPVHVVMVDWKTTWGKNNPTLQQWHDAIDTFGPPGTFAFPYLPDGYQP